MAKAMGKRLPVVALLLLGLAMLVDLATGLPAAGDPAAAEGSPRPNLRAKGLIEVKVKCFTVAFFTTMISGMSPYFFRRNSTFLVLGTQYAGGVFLATALLRFLFDSHNGFPVLTTKTYAFSEMLATAGYLITMFGYLVIQWVVLRAPKSLDEEKGAVKLGEKNHTVCVCAPEDSASCKCGAGNAVDNCCSEPVVKETLVHRIHIADTLLLLLALCIHSIFEGISIGVAATKADAWNSAWKISLHKIFPAIAMAIAVLRTIPKRPFLFCFSSVFAFANATPLGVGVGIIINSPIPGKVAGWVYAISMGLAAGVFIYVAVNHLLGKGHIPHSKTARDGPFHKFIAVVVGAAAIAVVQIWDT